MSVSGGDIAHLKFIRKSEKLQVNARDISPKDLDEILKSQMSPASQALYRHKDSMLVLHDRFCHLLAADIAFKTAYLLAGYAPSTGYQANAIKLYRQERTQEKVKRFKGGNYQNTVTDITPESVIEKMKFLAQQAESRADFVGAARIWEKLGQEVNRQFLQPKKIPGTQDLAKAMEQATADEIREQLDRLEAESDPAIELMQDEDDSQVQ